MPQSDPEVDQRAPEFDATFPADRAVPAAAGGLLLRRGQAPGPVKLRGDWPTGWVTDRGTVVAGPHHTPAGNYGQRPERGLRQQQAVRVSGVSDLGVEVGQQRQVAASTCRATAPQGPGSAFRRPHKRSATAVRTYRSGGGEPDEPSHAEPGQPVGSAKSAAINPPTLVPNTSGSANVNPGKQRSNCPSNWFFVAVRACTRRTGAPPTRSAQRPHEAVQ